MPFDVLRRLPHEVAIKFGNTATERGAVVGRIQRPGNQVAHSIETDFECFAIAWRNLLLAEGGLIIAAANALLSATLK